MDDAGLAMDENWKVLVSLFPKDWVERAWGAGAVERLRGFGDESALMRTLLLHVGRGYSLRGMVALVVRFVVAGKWSGFGGIDTKHESAGIRCNGGNRTGQDGQPMANSLQP